MGIPVWEAPPSYRHQQHIFRIQSSIRPDIAVFFTEPEGQSEAITLLPEAVIEIISPGYEAKDLSISVPFYLRSGIKDSIVLDPETGEVRHFRPGHSESRHQTPVLITLACGCEVTV